METPAFSDPMFIDASAPGGLNPAFGTVSGTIRSAGCAAWSEPGLVSPESMGYTLTGLIANIGLPYPWGLVTSGGAIVRAHGTQTGIDTQSYAVSFASLVPGTGSITAYLAATVAQIQQNPVPVPGPPPGHPAYDPTFVPTVAYTVTQDTVALSAVTSGIDNVNTFELARTTLTAGMSTLTFLNVDGWTRAGGRKAYPPILVSAGGFLTVGQAQGVVTPLTAGLTSTLPGVGDCGGLVYCLVNPTNGNWTISTSNSEPIVGMGGSGTVSVVLPASGSMTLWGNAASGSWSVLGSSRNLAPRGQQTFQSNGTFVVPQNIYQIFSRVWAGGGGGGGTISAGDSGAGGGGGGYSEGWFNVVPGQTIAVVVGANGIGVGGTSTGTAGGPSSVGSFNSATGGGGGGGISGGVSASPGTNGSGSGGSVNITAQTGGIGQSIAGVGLAGYGGSTYSSAGGPGGSGGGGATPGAGGSGGQNGGSGVNGGAGLVVIDY